MSSESLRGLPDRFREPPARTLTALAGDPTSSRTALDRLSVHGDGYFSRLHGTLQLEYPRLAAALGGGRTESSGLAPGCVTQKVSWTHPGAPTR